MPKPIDYTDVAFVYESDFASRHLGDAGAPAAQGVVFGRNVANDEFMRGWLCYGEWKKLLAVVFNQESGDAFARFFKEHVKTPGRSLEVVPSIRFRDRFFPTPPTRVLHLPQPMDVEFAWLRHHKMPHSFSMSGVTHTLSLKGVMERFRELVTGPFEEYDTLFCTSGAAVSVVRTAAENYATYLQERHGGKFHIRPRLERIPFGIDIEKFRPASTDERESTRQALGIDTDELCVLFVGRLSYYSKAQPFPMYRALESASRRLRKKIRLIVAGGADSSAILDKFKEGAHVIAPGVEVSFVGGGKTELFSRIWCCADVFVSLSDSIQETLGLTVLEAQACGLPVVTTDWNGCRESVAPGETGFLIPTAVVSGSTEDGTSRHLMNETSYGQFLGETNQAVAVDCVEAVNAIERLLTDQTLRNQMGLAGRQRVLKNYTWPAIIERYQNTWREQERVRQAHASAEVNSKARTPVAFPDVEHVFGSYPSKFLGSPDLVCAAPDAIEQLTAVLQLSLTNYASNTRITNEITLRELLHGAASPVELGRLESALAAFGDLGRIRRTLGWLLKYDLIRVWREPHNETGSPIKS